jgi:hypothetical protein
MDYVIVRASGPDADFTITPDHETALRIYQSWLGAYLAETGDVLAAEHLDRLNHAADRLRGRTIEYRSPRYATSAQPERVFVLGVLAWPAIWRWPPVTLSRDWGRILRRLDHPDGAFELRTDGMVWRIFWLDARSDAAFSTTRAYPVAAEAATDFAFIEAALDRHLPPLLTGVSRQRRG